MHDALRWINGVRITAVAIGLFAFTAEARATAPQDMSQADLARGFVEELLPETSQSAWEQYFKSGDNDAFSCAGDDQVRVKAAWSHAVNSRLRIERVVAAVVTAVAQDARRDDLLAGIALIRSPLGQKVRMLERTAAETTNPVEMAQALQHAATSLGTNPRRKALITELVKVTESVEFMVDLSTNVPLGVAIGSMRSPRSQTQHVTLEDLMQSVQQETAQARADITNGMHLNFAVAYRWLSDAELAKLIADSKLPSSQRLTKIINSAFNRAMRDEALAIGEAFAKELQSSRL